MRVCNGISDFSTAYSKTTHKVSAAWCFSTEGDAEMKAMEMCDDPTDCVMLFTTAYCGAVAKSSNALTYAYNYASEGGAQLEARKTCEEEGGTCFIVSSFCCY